MLRTSAMNKADLRLRVAERAVLIEQDAAGKIIARTGEPDADRLDRALHDGIAEFMRSYDWSFTDSQLIELTLSPDGTSPLCINSDPCRYRLPLCVESFPKGRPAWRLASQGTGGSNLDLMPAAHIAYLNYTNPNDTGRPRMLAGEWIPGNGADRTNSLALRVYPKPDQAYSVMFEARIGQPPLVSDDSLPIWPAVHDLTVVEFAALALLRTDFDASDPASVRKVQIAKDASLEALAKSIRRDQSDFLPASAPGISDLSASPIGVPVRLIDKVSGTVLYQGMSL